MYRQIDPRRNVSATKREAFPDHIKVLHPNILIAANYETKFSYSFKLAKALIYKFKFKNYP